MKKGTKVTKKKCKPAQPFTASLYSVELNVLKEHMKARLSATEIAAMLKDKIESVSWEIDEKITELTDRKEKLECISSDLCDVDFSTEDL